MIKAAPQRTRAVAIWPKIGPYHAARIESLRDHAAIEALALETRSESDYGSIFALGENTIGVESLGLDLHSPNSVLRRELHIKLNELAPSLVFTPGWSLPTALLAIEWCAARRVPFVLMSASAKIDHPRRLAKEFVKRRIVGLASAALVGGRPQADYIAELGTPRENIFIGYNTVDNDYFASGADAARRDAEALRLKHNLPRRYFVACVRLIEKKNLRRLIEAFAAYRAGTNVEPWDLVIIGPGPLEGELSAQIFRAGLEGSAHLFGARPYASLPTYYGLASALILPSTTDQWGLVVNEAMAAGLPVLVSERCGCHRDLVEFGRNGFTFDPYDVQAMTTAMARIASDACDEAEMGRASREIIARWTPRQFADGFEAAMRVALVATPRRASMFDRALLRALSIK